MTNPELLNLILTALPGLFSRSDIARLRALAYLPDFASAEAMCASLKTETRERADSLRANLKVSDVPVTLDQLAAMERKVAACDVLIMAFRTMDANARRGA